MAVVGALSVGASALAWLAQACSTGSGGSLDGYGYGYGYGFGARPGDSRERWARRGARRILGG